MESGPPASVFVAHKELKEKLESEAPPDRPALRLKVTKVKRATSEIGERKASRVNVVQLEQLATPVHKVQQDPQVLPELQAQPAQRDLRVHRALLDLRALLERLVHKELKARRVTKEIPEVLAQQGRKVRQVQLVLLVHQVCLSVESLFPAPLLVQQENRLLLTLLAHF